jgi:lipopolysaccharide/colanic/teichoic acid biosynthesis glycosyltransferase
MIQAAQHVIRDGAPRSGALAPGSEILEGPRGRHYNAVKRAIDVAAASLLLVLLSPVLAAVATAVKLDSPGPVLFVHERVGTRRVRRRGHPSWKLRPFRVFKFRSMLLEADPSVHEQHVAAVLNGQIADAKTIKLQDDERITRVGRVLRKASLDELPQLINVLRGEMSLVGPRPVPAYEVNRYGADYAQRFTALPGMSGLWQVRGRCALPFRAMISCDLEYVANPTILKDLAIMVRTVPAVLSGKGAG